MELEEFHEYLRVRERFIELARMQIADTLSIFDRSQAIRSLLEGLAYDLHEVKLLRLKGGSRIIAGKLLVEYAGSGKDGQDMFDVRPIWAVLPETKGDWPYAIVPEHEGIRLERGADLDDTIRQWNDALDREGFIPKVIRDDDSVSELEWKENSAFRWRWEDFEKQYTRMMIEQYRPCPEDVVRDIPRNRRKWLEILQTRPVEKLLCLLEKYFVFDDDEFEGMDEEEIRTALVEEFAEDDRMFLYLEMGDLYEFDVEGNVLEEVFR